MLKQGESLVHFFFTSRSLYLLRDIYILRVVVECHFKRKDVILREFIILSLFFLNLIIPPNSFVFLMQPQKPDYEKQKKEDLYTCFNRVFKLLSLSVTMDKWAHSFHAWIFTIFNQVDFCEGIISVHWQCPISSVSMKTSQNFQWVSFIHQNFEPEVHAIPQMRC